jgi:hypothetical protein
MDRYQISRERIEMMKILIREENTAKRKTNGRGDPPPKRKDKIYRLTLPKIRQDI